jgi:hypothetical protein
MPIMSRRGIEPRNNTVLTEHIDRALNLARRDGIGPALDFMLHAGVPRPVALRVLSAPELQRIRDRRGTGSGHH